MTLNEIITRARRLLDDEETDYLWPNGELTDYANDVIDGLCEECLLIEDSTTAEVCEIAVTTPTAIYTTHSSIVKITRAKLDNEDNPLTIKRTGAIAYMDANHTDWENEAINTPKYLLTTGNGDDKVRLWYPPKADDTLKLTVYRRPITKLNIASMSGVPEIQERYHRRIFNGILAEAYSKQDTDTLDLKKAEQHRMLWLQDIEAIKLYKLRENSAPTMVTPLMGAM